MSVSIIDYGVCNLGSVFRAFEECGADARLIDDPADLSSASRIVLPGVGAFADAMDALNGRNWVPAIREAVLDKKIPIIGICLGMQLFASKGIEGGEIDGINLIPGNIIRIDPTAQHLRIPHVGWNEIHKAKDSASLDNIADKSDVYFVHSYHYVPEDPSDILLKTPYGHDLVAAVERDHISGFQFHPEKSGRTGFQLIKNFLRN